MVVKVKKADKQSIIPIIFVMSLFGVGGILALYYIKDLIENFTVEYFFDIFSEYGLLILAGLFFLVLDLLFILQAIKKAQKYIAILEEKNIEEYNGNKITYMKFERLRKKGKKDSNPYTTYMCYTLGNNNLKEKNQYTISIKEFSNVIKSVEEIYDDTLSENNEENDKEYNLLTPVIILIFFVFGTKAIISVIKMIYDIKNYDSRLGIKYICNCYIYGFLYIIV